MSLLWDRTLNALNELFRWTAKEENTFTKWIDVWLRIFNQRAPIDVALMLKHSYIWTWCICFGVYFLKADQMLNSFTQCRTNSFFSLLFYYYFKFVICFSTQFFFHFSFTFSFFLQIFLVCILFVSARSRCACFSFNCITRHIFFLRLCAKDKHIFVSLWSSFIFTK